MFKSCGEDEIILGLKDFRRAALVVKSGGTLGEVDGTVQLLEQRVKEILSTGQCSWDGEHRIKWLGQLTVLTTLTYLFE